MFTVILKKLTRLLGRSFNYLLKLISTNRNETNNLLI